MTRTFLTTAALGAIVMLGVCGDDNGPGSGKLDEQEQAALIQGLAAGGVLSGNAVLAFSPLLGNTEVGSVGAFAAVASQIKLTVIRDQGTDVFTVSGVTGWSGLNTSAGTVDSAFAVTVNTTDGTIPSTISAAIPDDNALAFYFDGSTDSRYAPGTSGQFTLTRASFGSYQDCNQYEGEHNGVNVTECRYAVGTMTGNFDYVADRQTGTGADSHTQSNASYDLPAVQLLYTIDMRGVATDIARP